MNERVTVLNSIKHSKNVLYLIQRDQRVHDNYCVELGYDLSYASHASFYLGIEFEKLTCNDRQRLFILEGLRELKKECKTLNLPLHLIKDYRTFCSSHGVDCIVLDYSPLRESTIYNEKIADFCKQNEIACYCCDAHNIVPCKLLDVYKKSSKAVKTNLLKSYTHYLKQFKKLERHAYNGQQEKGTDSELESLEIKVEKGLDVYYEPRFRGGASNGFKQLETFFKESFARYAANRNSPDREVLSCTSPWTHTGQISAQRILLMAHERYANENENLKELVSELFVWREISEHFCMHEPFYDSLEGALPWAKETLEKHRNDKREKVYTLHDLERGRTYDELWNSCQKELIVTGKIHGYCRMYWAKRLLAWTESPERALEVGVYLNDRYALDGNDPNGYLGVMWSICGSMDQGFKERSVIGKIRPMNSFKTEKYTKKWGKRSID